MDDVQIDLHHLMNGTNHMDHGEFIRLAYQCASTFRATDNRGGYNGARIRFHTDWPINHGLNDTIALLEPIKLKYGPGLSYADLFVLAGNVDIIIYFYEKFACFKVCHFLVGVGFMFQI